MDKQNSEELKSETAVDNSRLEELIAQEITPQMEREVFKLLKEARLFMPVDFGPDAFKGLENAKEGDVIDGPSGFDIQYLTDPNGKKAVPLFTSEEMMRKADALTSVIVIYMSDLADMLKQTDKYSIIAINPFTQLNLNMPIEAFLSQFRDEIKIEDIKNEELRALLHKENLSDDDMAKFAETLMSSIMITGCVDADEGTSFVLIWDSENKPHLPLFTDLDEFEKIFSKHKEDVYPQAYHFMDLVKVAKGDFVINPASESLKLNSEMFKE
jgi:hypothetical protein